MAVSTSRSGVAAALAGVLLLAACSASSGGGSAGASSPSVAATASEKASQGAGYQLKVATTSAGDALTGEDNKTLYTFAKDSKGTSACTDSCAAKWPPFTLDNGETATAGDGVQASLIGTITRSDGTTQVTYADHPLYYYAADNAAGDVNGQGVGGLWFIASPSGTLGSPAASAAESPTADPSAPNY